MLVSGNAEDIPKPKEKKLLTLCLFSKERTIAFYNKKRIDHRTKKKYIWKTQEEEGLSVYIN